MVKLHIKRGDESQFLYETTCQVELAELTPLLVKIFNGRLKIERIFYGKRLKRNPIFMLVEKNSCRKESEFDNLIYK